MAEQAFQHQAGAEDDEEIEKTEQLKRAAHFAQQREQLQYQPE